MKNHYTDEQLIGLLASKDLHRVDKAVTQLYQQHKEMVFRLVKRNSGTEQDAEEVFNDALIGLWQAVAADRYQPSARLKTYLYQIARNLWWKQIRGTRKEMVLIDTEYIDARYQSAGTDEIYEIREMFDNYWDRVRAVGDKCYQILWAFAEGYTMQEIAVRFELGTADNAKAAKYNCLKKAGKPIND